MLELMRTVKSVDLDAIYAAYPIGGDGKDVDGLTWNTQVIYARQAVLASFCLNWAFTHVGVTLAEQKAIEETEILLRGTKSPLRQYAAMIRLGRFWGDTGEPLWDDEKEFIRDALWQLEQLHVLPLEGFPKASWLITS